MSARPAPSASAERRPVGRSANVLLALVSLAVVLVTLEIGVRTYAWLTGRGFWENPRDFVSPFFTIDGWPAPYRDGDVFEFREGERVPAAKAPGEIRVVCLGGSTTLRGRDAEGISYPHELGVRLAERFPGRVVRVLNAGQNAYSSAHSLVNLALRVLDVEPDVVTVYEDINDLSVNWFGSGATSDYANKYLTTHYLGWHHRTGLLADLGRASRLVRVVDNRLELFRFEARDYDPARDYRPGLRYFERNLRSIVAVARAQGVDVVLGTQAARSSMRTSTGFMAYNQVTRDVAARMDVPLAEVADAVVDDALFVDDVHNTSPGARAVAARWVEPVAGVIERRLAGQGGRAR
jgi:lysophospholipase L1-like esterase